MSKRNLTKKEQAAERDYYEKICRLERWQIISRLFDCMSAEISTMLVVCMESAKTRETDENYSTRCREERKLLNVILEGVVELRNSAVHEGIERYTSEKPVKPGWLP